MRLISTMRVIGEKIITAKISRSMVVRMAQYHKGDADFPLSNVNAALTPRCYDCCRNWEFLSALLIKTQ